MSLTRHSLKMIQLRKSWFSTVVVLTIAVSLVIAIGVSGQVCSGCEVAQQTVTKANKLLILDDV